MKLAIAISVSKYAPPLSDLPGCTTDSNVVNAILRSQSDFQDVLIISSSTDSSSTKVSLSQFVKKHKGAKVEQLLFYFSGHGLFQGDEFYYLFSDYEATRQKQSSLQNTELDALLRSLSPEVTIKIVDACQSGVQYIKDQGSMAQYLKGTQDRFHSCYFMYSSRNTESSYQSGRISDFTRVIAECITNSPGPSIRYKDVIDYISDAFSQNSVQTPFFVTQADFTDTFCQVTDDLKRSIASLLAGNKATEQTTLGNTEASLLSTMPDLAKAVELEAQKYCTREEATERVQYLKHLLESAHAPRDVEALFTLVPSVSDTHDNIPSRGELGEWFEKREHDYMAEAVSESRSRLKLEYRRNLSPLQQIGAEYMSVMSPFRQDSDKYETYWVTTGVKSTVELPFAAAMIKAGARFPNLRSKSLFVVPFISRTTLLCFYGIADYEQKGWDQEEMLNSVTWEYAEIILKDKDALTNFVNKTVLPKYWRSVIDPVAERFRPSESQTGVEQGG